MEPDEIRSVSLKNYARAILGSRLLLTNYVLTTLCFSFQGTGYQTNSNTFIFSLRNHQGISPFKAFPQLSSYHVHVGSSNGPVFGGGHDIIIDDQYIRTNLGHTYTAPVTMNDKDTFLAGTYSFIPTEIEVFYLSTY